MNCPDDWTCVDTGQDLICVECTNGDISFGKDFNEKDIVGYFEPRINAPLGPRFSSLVLVKCDPRFYFLPVIFFWS